MRFMKKLPLLIAFLAGLGGAYLRGHELAYCYNTTTYLYTADYASWLLPALGGALALLFIGVALARDKSELDFDTLYGFGAGGTLAGVFTALVMAAAGALLIFSFLSSRSYLDLTFGAFTVFTGISLLVVTSARKKQRSGATDGFFTIVPVFWGSFFVIRTFMEHPVEPVIRLFACDLLAVCAALLALYGCAAKLYGGRREKLTLIASLLAVALLTAATGGRLAAALMSGDLSWVREVWARLAISAALIPALAVNAALLLDRLPMKTREREDEL